MDKCAKILGRIYTLSYIDKNISLDEFIFKIDNSKNKKFIEGSISIFTEESNFKNYNELCVNSLKYFLQNNDLSSEMVYKIESLFFKEENFKYISLDFVKSIISNLSTKQNRYDDFDDEDLVKEVLDLQERLFKLNVQVDKLYEEYEN